jgi:hypothetical protein
VHEREEDHRNDVSGGGALPGVSSEAIAARHPKHAGNEHGPCVPVGDVEGEQDVERLLAVGEERDVVVGLESGEDAERGRHGKDAKQADTSRRIHLCTIGRGEKHVKSVSNRSSPRDRRSSQEPGRTDT